MMEGASWNPLQSIADLVGKKIEADAAVKTAARQTFDQGHGLAVDEYGNQTARGQVALTPATLLSSPVAVAGAVVLAAALIYALTR